MLIFRWLVALLILMSALGFVFYLGTGQVRYRNWALLLFKWTIIAALAFFAVLFAGRIV